MARIKVIGRPSKDGGSKHLTGVKPKWPKGFWEFLKDYAKKNNLNSVEEARVRYEEELKQSGGKLETRG